MFNKLQQNSTISVAAAKRISNHRVSSTSLLTNYQIYNNQFSIPFSQKHHQQQQEIQLISSSNNNIINNNVDWSKALTAYYTALFSGSNLREGHALNAVRQVVSNIAKMPHNRAARVLKSLGTLSEEAPLTYGPHCIEAATTVCVIRNHHHQNNELQQQQNSSSSVCVVPPTQKRLTLLSNSSCNNNNHSLLFQAAVQTIARHRFTLVDSNHSIAVKAVTNCMSEGRWDAALHIATQLPTLIRHSSSSILSFTDEQQQQLRGSSRTTSQGSAIHLGAYLEALNQAVKRDQQKAISALLQLIQQQQNVTTTTNISRDHHRKFLPFSSSYHHPEFYLNGLTSNDLKRMLLGFNKVSDQGWRIASVLFSSVTFKMQNNIKKDDNDDDDQQDLIFDPSVVNASLALLATHEKFDEASKIVSLKVRHLEEMEKQKKQKSAMDTDHSAVISTAVKVLRQTPWNVALELVSKLTVSAGSNIDNQSANDIAALVLRYGPQTSWEHAAAALNLLLHTSPLNKNRNKTMMINHLTDQQQQDAPLVVEATQTSRLTVKLLAEGKTDLAQRALRHVRATGDLSALSGALNAFVLRAKTIPDCDHWITTMIEEGLAPSRTAREHVVRLYCDDGDWQQALCSLRDLDTPFTTTINNNNNLQLSSSSAEKEKSVLMMMDRRFVSPKTHVFLQRSMRAAGAPWDVAVKTFVELESGGGRSYPKQDEASVQQVAEAFRSVVATCMEQRQDQVAQDLLSIMIQKGVGRRS
jgi:hypothetical protein